MNIIQKEKEFLQQKTKAQVSHMIQDFGSKKCNVY